MGKVAPERIQRFRTELGYTQEDLADLCGVDASCISRWETGKWSPSASNSLRLAQALFDTEKNTTESKDIYKCFGRRYSMNIRKPRFRLTLLCYQWPLR